MLRKVVLPAPLLPIRPTTLSCSMLTLMSAAAVTAPNVLLSLRASRTTVMSRRLAPAREYRPQPAGQEHDHQQHGDTQHHLPGVGRILVRVAAHRLEDGRAEERRQHAAGTRQDGDEDELSRG